LFIDLIKVKLKLIKTGRLPRPPLKGTSLGKMNIDACKELLIHNTKLSEIKRNNITDINKLFGEIINDSD
jgi:hypothetical protein